MSPSIILIRPQMGENIGAVARVMHNFAFTDLRIVKPRDKWPNKASIATASHASFLLDNAKIFASTEEAIEDLQILHATTLRPRDMVKPVSDAASWIIQAKQQINSGTKIGVMFGPERTGLENHEVTLAQNIITIPTNPDYGSLNLAQAVNIVCYEWFRSVDSCQLPVASSTDLAAHSEIIGLYEHLETVLEKADFFKVPEKKAGMIQNIRNIFSRNNLTSQEVRTLRGIIRNLTGGA